MARKLLFLNILLLAGVVLLGLRLIYGWNSFQEEHSPEKLFAQANTQNNQLPDYQPRGLDDPDFLDYSVVIDRNLFSEDRRPPVEGDEDASVELPPEIRDPLLHGVARIGNYTLAQITKFDTRSPQGSRVQVSEGDDLGGWTVAEINTDAMILRWKDHEKEIPKTIATRQQAAARPGRGGGGVRIITIGSRSAAVETVTSSSSESEEQSGLQVAAVGQQQGNARGGAQTRGAQQQQGQDLTGRQNTRGTRGNASSSRSRNNRLQSNRPIQQGRPPRQ